MLLQYPITSPLPSAAAVTAPVPRPTCIEPRGWTIPWLSQCTRSVEERWHQPPVQEWKLCHVPLTKSPPDESATVGEDVETGWYENCQSQAPANARGTLLSWSDGSSYAALAA